MLILTRRGLVLWRPRLAGRVAVFLQGVGPGFKVFSLLGTFRPSLINIEEECLRNSRFSLESNGIGL